MTRRASILEDELTPESRCLLLERLSDLRIREAEYFDPRQFFLPLRQHREALLPACVLILGVRGAGKSALFQLLVQLDDASLRNLLGLSSPTGGRWLDAYSLALPHPQTHAVDQLAHDHGPAALTAFWIAHLLRRIHAAEPALIPDLQQHGWLLGRADGADGWMRRASTYVDLLARLLDEVEERLASSGQRMYACYDHLDRIGRTQPLIRRNAVGTLLSLWSGLAIRYKQLRGKVFLRQDRYDDAVSSFADASKLRPRAVTLTWSHSDLFRGLVRNMAALGPEMNQWLDAVTGLRFRELDGFGRLPGDMPDEVQRALATRLAGVVIGSGIMQSYTHRWLRSSVVDVQQEGVPRTLPSLIGNAAVEALRSGSKARGVHLLTRDDLRQGLIDASRDRMRELQEDIPVVRRLESLAGREMPMKETVLVRLLAKKVVGEEPGLPADGEQVLAELVNLRVFTRTPEKLYDLPDLYQYGYGIQRTSKPIGDDNQEIRREAGHLLAAAQALSGSEERTPLEQAYRSIREAEALEPGREAILEVFGEVTFVLMEHLVVDEVSALVYPCLEALAPALEAPRLPTTIASFAAQIHEELSWRKESGMKHLLAARDLNLRIVYQEPRIWSAWLRLAREHVWHAWREPGAAPSLLREARTAHREAMDVISALEAREAGGWEDARAWGALALAAINEADWLLQGDPVGVRHAERAFQAAFPLDVQPRISDPFGMRLWGSFLLHRSRSGEGDWSVFLREAKEKLRQAAILAPPKVPFARGSLAYIALCETVDGDMIRVQSRAHVFADLEEIARHVPAAACYPLACYYGLEGDADHCLERLRLTRGFGQLPPLDHLRREPCLARLLGSASFRAQLDDLWPLPFHA